MNDELIIRVLQSPTDDVVESFLNDEETVFWVDWRDEDESIVEMCESLICTGTLSAEIVDTDNEAGFEMYVSYQGKRVLVPLIIGTEDRHITLVTLNEILRPDYEVRLCIDSNGSDTLAFIPLACEVWQELEDKYGKAVGKRFYKLQEKPNVFTDPLRF